MLEGVAATVADPPEIDKTKSPTSNAPLPPFVSYTASLKVTDIVAGVTKIYIKVLFYIFTK